MAAKRALLIFARRPVGGKVKTRLTPSLLPGKAAELYRCMLEDALERTARLRDLDRLLIYDPGDDAASFFRSTCPDLLLFPQRGNGLGERLKNAFDLAFSLGYGAVAAIGTDSPDLPLNYVEDAFRYLEEEGADVVFGPATDGGYYLVASGKPSVGLFQGIPWSTAGVLEASERNAGRLGLRTVRLEVWHDLDTVDDLKRFLLEGNPDSAPRTAVFLREHADLITTS